MGLFVAAGTYAHAAMYDPLASNGLNPQPFIFSYGATTILVLSWIVYTFFEYGAGFGLMAIVEVFAGGTLARANSHTLNIKLGVASFPILVIAWLIL
jgi:hypothetical protein